MNNVRRAAVAASTVLLTVLLTLAGAVIGLGGSTAQAYEVSASPDVVVVDLTAQETSELAASSDAVARMCALVDGRSAQISLIRPPVQFGCEGALTECANRAPGTPMAVVFYWFSTECRF